MGRNAKKDEIRGGELKMDAKVEGVKRRLRIMYFIKNYLNENGYPPSFREIGVAVGLASSSTVKTHMDILKKQGLITFNPSSPRTIRVIKK